MAVSAFVRQLDMSSRAFGQGHAPDFGAMDSIDALRYGFDQSMIPKNGYRLCEKTMLHKE
ncbi:MAG TPA: hypothetical protein VGV39_05700 [Mesorhizobium sp.]|jgi:hypothetical protein|uniref:hypothetical protein n=1 Tax=Mesorhizobium sp. TaxID=1871066 RepID=UPI002DDC9F2D|nr:hypothetical protein [Mesorhizobium sp.]HEV2502547.1 hypothetical protein [Mesorhizobium sp.]